MTTLVNSYNSKIYHLTDNLITNVRGQDNSVKTRCNKRLVNFSETRWGIDWENQPSDIITCCTHCGSLEDFMTVSRQKWAEEKARQEREIRDHEYAKKRQEERLQAHRKLMAQFSQIIEGIGGTITKTNEQAAGGKIEFELDGLKFQLSGNIW